jgi:hypothetical protein
VGTLEIFARPALIGEHGDWVEVTEPGEIHAPFAWALGVFEFTFFRFQGLCHPEMLDQLLSFDEF